MSESSCAAADPPRDPPPPTTSWAPLPGIARAETSSHPLILGASPGTTGTMSLYYALMALGVSAVHYSRQFNATAGSEVTSYADGGGPVPLLRPIFSYGQWEPGKAPPPVDLGALRSLDLRFLSATDALLDTPAMEVFFDALATFPEARVVITAREPRVWAESRRVRHPTDRAPLFPLLGFDVPMGALSADQSAMSLALWHRAVAASVPPERLLVLDVFSMDDDELWRKLSAFVGRSLPPRDPATGLLPKFPHMRYGEDVPTVGTRAPSEASDGFQ
jgi:hypothetical protein